MITKSITFSVLLLGQLFASAAFARSRPAPFPTANDDWQTIASDSRVLIKQTDLADAFGDKGFMNACVDGDLIRSIQPLHVCGEVTPVVVDLGWGRKQVQNKCTRWDNQSIAVPIHHVADQTCRSWTIVEGKVRPCAYTDTVTYNTSTEPTFQTWELRMVFTGSSNSVKPVVHLFDKAYEIPNCR